MVITTADNVTLEIAPGGLTYFEDAERKVGACMDWPELSPEVQERLEGIQDDIEALIKEGIGLIR